MYNFHILMCEWRACFWSSAYIHTLSQVSDVGFLCLNQLGHYKPEERITREYLNMNCLDLT